MRKIWVDCDPGMDDAVALCFLAANREQFQILGISTVAGNQTIEKVTENALRLADFLGLDVPVVQGAAAPLSAPLKTGEAVHGKTGLGSVTLPESSRCPESGQAWKYLYEQLMLCPEQDPVTIAALGPLTNLALLLREHPEVRPKIREIVFMGGAAWGGNVTAAAEFNVYTDPEAAQIVLEAGIPTVMCGLDVTMQCGLTRQQIAKLCQAGGSVSALCGEWLGGFLQVPVYQVQPVIPAHDAVPFAYLLHPEIFGGEKLPVIADCTEGPGRGQTICDRRYLQDPDELWVKVLLRADGNAFQKYLIESLFELDIEKK